MPMPVLINDCKRLPIAPIFKRFSLYAAILCCAVATTSFVGTSAYAADAQSRFKEGQQLFQSERYLQAARYYFSVYTDEEGLRNEALGRLTESLIQARYPNAATYFYIKTLKSGSRPAIQRVLRYLPSMIDAVGGDILRNYVLAHTTESDFDSETRNHFFYFLGKSHLLRGEPAEALDALKKVHLGSRGMGAPVALLRASAHAMLNQTDQAIEYFKICEQWSAREKGSAAFDLENRCRAGQARTLYQMGRHDDAEDIYDDISKKSFVWTDILFEQAWNSYAKGDFNRSLGKLVSYRSPALKFVFNPEIGVLQAQSFVALCLYDDVNKTVNEFNKNYYNVGVQMKNTLTSHSNDYMMFYNMGRGALRSKLHSDDMMKKALNRFVRGPYFASIVAQENAALREGSRLRTALGSGSGGFNDFLNRVTNWRVRSIRILGGVFVRNSMIDLYNDLLADLDKMSFIKSEMLSQMKTRLERRHSMSTDDDGVLKRGHNNIDRRDYQYFWSFNGEFWNDELGDYVFALDSECR